MIPLNDRSTLTEALTPPAGHVFDAGVGTTFSMDLVSLLALPAHLAWLASSEEQLLPTHGAGPTGDDGIRVLEGIRRSAKRLSIFCDKGRIQVPRAPHLLTTLLEPMIHEARAPHGGAFHPKLWALRFMPESGNGSALLRLLVLSRNLTNDRSWDLALCLEGTPGRSNVRANAAVAGFIRTLPTVSEKALGVERAADIQSLADDVQRCDWDSVGNFDSVDLHVLGMSAKAKAFLPAPADEIVVISPFLKNGALRELAERSGRPLAIVSRADSLNALSAEIRDLFDATYTLSDDALPEEESETADSGCTGLHAKAIITRTGASTTLYVGSANCTDAALLRGSNVEVVAELKGRRTKVGSPSDWLGESGLGSLLRPHEPVKGFTFAEDDGERALEEVRQRFVESGLALRCQVLDSGLYSLTLEVVPTPAAASITVAAWPLSRSQDEARLLDDATGCTLIATDLTADLVTSLTGFAVRSGDTVLTFALDLPVDGLPPDRETAVFRRVLQNRPAFFHYLALLLSGIEGGSGTGHPWHGRGLRGGGGMGSLQTPIVEMLLRACSRAPEKLEAVARAVECVSPMQDDGQPTLPPEFIETWNTIRAACDQGGKA